jgi:hypothetical protein
VPNDVRFASDSDIRGGELSSMRQDDTPAYNEICWL